MFKKKKEINKEFFDNVSYSVDEIKHMNDNYLEKEFKFYDPCDNEMFIKISDNNIHIRAPKYIESGKVLRNTLDVNISEKVYVRTKISKQFENLNLPDVFYFEFIEEEVGLLKYTNAFQIQSDFGFNSKKLKLTKFTSCELDKNRLVLYTHDDAKYLQNVLKEYIKVR